MEGFDDRWDADARAASPVHKVPDEATGEPARGVLTDRS
jgi:hypothetical protein